ncbi:tetratricopeptide repeat protein [Stigmatella aurantiaca]|uniref:Tetratricopeptide repeat family n=1 Tax=Stigmatella aurantiaca (strain DW4/3-1) TaxID=378806 RepID=Q08YL9_STIAD|nr:tetratricopeptide repeat protein [Stigmatella aurantiaca]ADO73788.1 Tetratricopeptide repeat family [Stigmatella aurantiaca DW4/3-1]EAU65561.1 tetratricopeptide repeat family [Stigmatella aurantiaca DW4/3-1]
MSTSLTKTLSPAELAKLEHAFAADPSSDAYKPLAEAYLGMGRFMEAMVVCKKGVKAHPNASDPRLLLARVYAEQGKDKKALEEALSALQVQPADKAALRMAGSLQLKTGEPEPGKANLLKAWQVDPNDSDTLSLIQQYKVELPKPAAPAPVAPAPVAAAPVASAPVAAAPVAAAPVAAASVQTQPVASGLPVARPNGTPARTENVARPVAPTPRRPVAVEQDDDIDVDDDDDASPRRRAKQNSSSKYITLGLFVVIVASVVGYSVVSSRTKRNNLEYKKQLDAATEQLKHDSFDSYKKACEAADKALEVYPDGTAAHGYLAYAYAIRWGEHGGGDDARRRAEEHLAAAKKGTEVSSHLYASEALIKTYGGKGKEGLGELETRVKAFDAEGKASSLLYLTLGLVQMNAGDLEHARDNLEKAQSLSPDDPRIYASLGAVYRRLGQDAVAWQKYDFALRYEKDHPESLLGKGLLILEQDEPNFEMASAMLKKLLVADPPPSPRQLAAAQLARSLLVSRVSASMATLKPDVQAKLSEATGVPVDKEKARADMLKAEQDGFALDKANPELLLIKGRRLLAEGQPDAAAEEMRKAIKMDSSRAQFHVELAKALMGKQGGEKEAAEALTTALRTMGDSPKLVVMLGNAYRRQGKLDDAITQYQRAVKDPKAKNPEARLAMGGIYRERSEWEKAQEQLEKASQEFVGQSDRAALALTELGRVFQGKGDATKAEEAYQKALNADENYSPAYYFYASALSKDRKQGDKVRALAQEYLKRDPKGEHASDAQRLASGG